MAQSLNDFKPNRAASAEVSPIERQRFRNNSKETIVNSSGIGAYVVKPLNGFCYTGDRYTLEAQEKYVGRKCGCKRHEEPQIVHVIKE